VALDVLEHANHAVGAGREEPRLARVEDGAEDALAAHHAVAPEHLPRERDGEGRGQGTVTGERIK